MNMKGLMAFGCKEVWVQLRIHYSFVHSFPSTNRVKLTTSRLLASVVWSPSWGRNCRLARDLEAITVSPLVNGDMPTDFYLDK